MRAVVLPAFALLLGCSAEPPARDDCERADRIFGRCGVSLPVVQTQTCSGVAKAVAKCVVEVGTDCDALAQLSGHLDVCIAAANDELPPIEDPPIDAPDGGTDAGEGSSDDLARAVDLGAPPDLGSPADLSTPAWPGLDQSGSLAAGSTRSFQAAVAPGTYQVSITGTGDVDLYVRLGKAPTSTLYDCRPYLIGSDESCTVTVAALDILYVLLRSDVEDSTFHLIAKED
jgi:hypothetical protein